MTEPDRWQQSVTPARRRVVAAMRETAEMLVRFEADEETLARAAEHLAKSAALLAGGPDRARRIDELKVGAYGSSPSEGEETHHNPDCIVCGPGNPSGHGMIVHREGDGVVGRLTVGPVARGAPGRAHGGVLALAIDDLMGHVLVVLGLPAYTVRLDVEYVAPPPLDAPLELRSWAVRHEGRRLTIGAEVRSAGDLLARAEGLFITVDRLDGDEGP